MDLYTKKNNNNCLLIDTNYTIQYYIYIKVQNELVNIYAVKLFIICPHKRADIFFFKYYIEMQIQIIYRNSD